MGVPENNAAPPLPDMPDREEEDGVPEGTLRGPPGECILNRGEKEDRKTIAGWQLDPNGRGDSALEEHVNVRFQMRTAKAALTWTLPPF